MLVDPWLAAVVLRTRDERVQDRLEFRAGLLDDPGELGQLGLAGRAPEEAQELRAHPGRDIAQVLGRAQPELARVEQQARRDRAQGCRVCERIEGLAQRLGL